MQHATALCCAIKHVYQHLSKWILQIVILCLTVDGFDSAHAQSLPKTESLLGGQFVETLWQGPYAYIEGEYSEGDFSCSGLLVGKREILTAGHCLPDSASLASYQIFVGGNIYTAQRLNRHPLYNDNLEYSNIQNSQYDISILELERDVVGVSPVPIALNYPIKENFSLIVVGFGTHETFGLGGPEYQDAGQYGKVKIAAVEGGMIFAERKAGQSAVCGGDSGGPLLLFAGQYAAVSGVTSLGTTRNQSVGNCVASAKGGDISAWVDLQSQPSLSFLSRFPGIYGVNFPNVIVGNDAESWNAKLIKALSAKKISQLRKSVNPVRSGLARDRSFNLDITRRGLIKGALKQITLAKKSSSLKSAKKFTRAAQVKVQELVGFGFS